MSAVSGGGRPAVALARRAAHLARLVSASEASRDVRFGNPMLAVCVLPRTDPGDRKRWVRRNGPYVLSVEALGGYGLPYGTVPRLILMWMTNEIVRTGKRELSLGPSFARFLADIGLRNFRQGGARSDRARVAEQLRRLLHTVIQLEYVAAGERREVRGFVAERNALRWVAPDGGSRDPELGWGSRLVVGQSLYEEMMERPFPLHVQTIRALTHSALALDLYGWLAYRVATLEAPLDLPWRTLTEQLGTHDVERLGYDTVRLFRRMALAQLRLIRIAWPQLRYETPTGALRLFPATPPIPRTAWSPPR